MNKQEILNLKPRFRFGNTTMTDWFIVTESANFYSIRNGLRHADSEIKSPYYYEDCTIGKNAKKIAFEKFSTWWNSLNIK